MKKFLKKYKIHFLAFFIPIILLSSYVLLSGHKFSDLLIGDAQQQYVYLFDYFKSVLNGDQSIFWAFSRGMGGNMYGAFFYYLSSPLNILLLFVPFKYIQSFIPILSIIKIGLCGFTMYYYLNKRNNNHYLLNLTFALSYSLMSYNIIYLFSIMWLDVVYLAPLVILQIDKMLDGNKSAHIFYIIFLSISIFSNYYISYMLCIFCVIYFIFRLFTKKELNDNKLRKKLFIKFILSSLFCGLLLAFELLPIGYEMKNFYRDNIFYDFTNFELYSLKNLINAFNIQPLSVSVFRTPNIFCGYLIVYIIINYLISSKDKKEKIGILLVIIFFFLSFIFPFLIYIWHGFSYPILYGHREAFLFCLFIIIIASEKIGILKELTLNTNSLIVFILTMISFLSLIFLEFNYSILVCFFGIFFLISNIYLVNLVIKYNTYFHKLAILILCILECFIYFKFNLLLLKDVKYVDERFNLLEVIKNNVNEEEIIRLGSITDNPLETINSKYNNLSYFLSNNNKRLSKFLKNSGYFIAANNIYSNFDNTFMNNFLGINYNYNVDKNTFETTVEKNDNSLQIGYMINKNIDLIYDNPFIFQNSITKSLTDLEIFEEIAILDNINNEFQIIGDKNIYIFAKTNYLKEEGFKLIINGEDFSSTNKIKKVSDSDLLHFIISRKEEIEKIYIYKLNMDNYKKVLEILGENQIYNIKINKNELTFSIDNQDKETLLLTIPYDEGYNVYVDGIKKNYYAILDTFIGIDLETGNHNIKIIYIPKLLKEGLIISTISLIIFIIYIVKNCKKINNI